MIAPALTAFEHQPLPISVQGGADVLSEAEAEHLMLIAERLPGFCVRGFKSILLKEHCGLINLGGRMLEILPKVGELREEGTGRGVLLRLLRHASALPLHRQTDVNHGSRSATLLDVFISAFFEEVFTLLKGGLLHRYVEHEDDLPAVRGGIRFQRQLSTLAKRTDLVACRFDEQTPDHRWNRLIKAGLRVVRHWIRGLSLNRQWTELSAAFEEVSDVTHPRALLVDIRYDRQAVRYRPSITWVGRILNLLSPDFRAGEDRAPGLLFDMNLLFERVVEHRMAQWAEDRGWVLETQDNSRFLAEIMADPFRPAYRLRPDLVFRRGTQVVAIADSKWKQPDLSGRGFVLPSPADVYQLQAYACAFGGEHLGLIYPRSDHLARANETVFRLPPVANLSPRLTVLTLDVTDDTLPLGPASLAGRWSAG